MNLDVKQTKFTAGELDTALAGRIDADANASGCRLLRNVVVLPTGGLKRRPGTRIIAELSGCDRLIPLDLSTGSVVVSLSAGRIEIVEGGLFAASLAAPWSAAQTRQVRWTRRGSTLLLCHPAIVPQELVRSSSGQWTLQALVFSDGVDAQGLTVTLKPFHRFANSAVSLQASLGSNAASAAIPANSSVTVRSSQAVFTAAHLYSRLKIRGRQLTILNIVSSTQVLARSDQPLIDGQATYDWTEEAWSNAHGWPATVALYQDRLVFGGSRDLAGHVWLSQIGDHFNFDVGTGLDDEAIAFGLSSDGRHEIVALMPARHLQILTSRGEWVLRGTPVTPTDLALELQTSVGSMNSAFAPPVFVDGATLFIGSNGRELREFTYTNAEQAYQAADLSVLWHHLLVDPSDMAFDAKSRLLYVARADGCVIAVTVDRAANIAAGSLLTVDQRCLALAASPDAVYLGVLFNGRYLLEKLDETLQLDHCIQKTSPTPTTSWSGLNWLSGRPIVAMTGAQVVARTTLVGTSIVLATPTMSLTTGVSFTHVIEAVPIAFSAEIPAGFGRRHRLVQASFRLRGTPLLSADVGGGSRRFTVASTDADSITDVRCGGLGWQDSVNTPPWRIEQDEPTPFTLLAATLSIKVL